jgi:hypothetical protein
MSFRCRSLESGESSWALLPIAKGPPSFTGMQYTAGSQKRGGMMPFLPLARRCYPADLMLTFHDS